MAGEVFSGAIAMNLKETLEEIITDQLDGVESDLDYTQWMLNRPMNDAYEDDQEYAGGGLIAEVPEGTELPPLTITADDCRWIETSFDSVIAASHKVPGAIWSLGKTLVDNAVRKSA